MTDAHQLKCLVLGGAECVWDDVAALEALVGEPWPGLTVAVNDIGVHWPRRLDHWASLHPEKFATDRQHPRNWGWVQQREERGHPGGFETWGRRARTDRRLAPWGGGASGLYAVAVAYELGCTRIVLCGVPMQRTPHFAESVVHPHGRPWGSADAHWKTWRKPKVMARMQGVVKSMSGRTRDALGAPTAEWLRQGTASDDDVAA